MIIHRLLDWLRSRRASVAIESAITLSMVIVSFSSLTQIVGGRLHEDLLERAAYAVTREAILETEPAASEGELRERAVVAIQKELGNKLETDLLQIEIDAYDDVCQMTRGVESSNEFARLGGDAQNMVVIRLSYLSSDTWNSFFTGQPQRLQKLALGRNEPRQTDDEEED